MNEHMQGFLVLNDTVTLEGLFSLQFDSSGVLMMLSLVPVGALSAFLNLTTLVGEARITDGSHNREEAIR
jgi:hypothetical protein